MATDASLPLTRNNAPAKTAVQLAMDDAVRNIEDEETLVPPVGRGLIIRTVNGWTPDVSIDQLSLPGRRSHD